MKNKIKHTYEKVLKKYYVYLDVHGYYGNQQTTIEFDNSDYGPRYDVFAKKYHINQY